MHTLICSVTRTRIEQELPCALFCNNSDEDLLHFIYQCSSLHSIRNHWITIIYNNYFFNNINNSILDPSDIFHHVTASVFIPDKVSQGHLVSFITELSMIQFSPESKRIITSFNFSNWSTLLF